jgi:hypothetical protein
LPIVADAPNDKQGAPKRLEKAEPAGYFQGESMTRRTAFTVAVQALGGAAGLAVALPAVGFAVAPLFEGVPCLVDNSKLFVTSFTEEDMYNVNGQEYGHCLGLEHVEYDGPSDGVLEDDVMWGTYEQNPGDAGNHRQCPSNLNVAGLELVFGSLFGGPSGGTATLSPAEYQKISC